MTYHHFSTTQDVAVGDSMKKLGSEVDITFTYPILPRVTLQGYSTMFGTEAFMLLRYDYNRWQD